MKKIALFLVGLLTLLCGLLFLSSEEPGGSSSVSERIVGKGGRKSICLNMIVKNESPVIEKCLTSIKPLIDYWVIFDTGSKDGTQEIIKRCMKDVPGKLYESPWVNFAHNRNEVLNVARHKTDYSLFIDADEMILYPSSYELPPLDRDIYYITVQQKGASEYLRTFLVNNRLDWHWEGVIHEDLVSSQVRTAARIEGIVNFSDTLAGHRSQDPHKYLHDAEVLVAALKDEPENSRYQFYLAQAYANAGEYSLAMEEYKKRAEMKGGMEEEIFWSLLRYARIQEIFCMPPAIFIQSYQEAYRFRPSRSEPLYYLGKYYLSQGKNELAYQVLKEGSQIPSSRDALFVERFIYDWEMLYKLGEACYRLGKYGEFQQVIEKLLVCKNVPEAVRGELEHNLTILRSMR